MKAALLTRDFFRENENIGYSFSEKRQKDRTVQKREFF
jgi:hypothetical protein